MKSLKNSIYICIAISFFSCKENIKFSYNDAIKSDIDFLFENNKTLEIDHDLDNSILFGYFTTKNKLSYLNTVDSFFAKRKWIFVVNDERKKILLQKYNLPYQLCSIELDGNNVSIKLISL